MKKHIWVIGAARSGTSYLANFIGKHTDLCLVEDPRYHPINIDIWKFQEPYKSLVFKLNNNFVRTATLSQKFENSLFVHVFRDPSHVLYSMIHPKTGSTPHRLEWKNDFPKALAFWEHFITGCLSVKNCKICHIRYETIPQNLSHLSDFLSIQLDQNKLHFQNRNTQMVDKDYLNYLEYLWAQDQCCPHLKLRQQVESFPDFFISQNISYI